MNRHQRNPFAIGSAAIVVSALILLAAAFRLIPGVPGATSGRPADSAAPDRNGALGPATTTNNAQSTAWRSPQSGPASQQPATFGLERAAARDSSAAASTPAEGHKQLSSARGKLAHSAASAADALDGSLPIDTAPVEVEYATIAITPDNAAVGETITVAVRLCCDPALESAVTAVEIDLEQVEVPGRLIGIKATAATGLEAKLTPHDGHLISGQYRAWGVTVSLASGRTIDLGAEQLRARDPALSVVDSAAPLSIARARIVSAETSTAGPMPSLEVAVDDDFRGTGTLYLLARHLDSGLPMQSVGPILLPYSRHSLIELRRWRKSGHLCRPEFDQGANPKFQLSRGFTGASGNQERRERALATVR
ncbi:MAG: hypothetical protein HYV63_31950, partial [Candidatus Schekmanbacteria bacterium]|nr:hypothetical protein [Candidatus Schekmanbacteria bacterium]